MPFENEGIEQGIALVCSGGTFGQRFFILAVFGN